MAKQHTFPTSTIQITKPSDYSVLEAQFKLIRYIIPSSFRGKNKNDRYKLLHVELRPQLSVPYRTFEYDNLDNVQCEVIYALYPREMSDVAPLVISFLSDDQLVYREIGFHEISTFNLLKLLQAAYFNVWPHFASMGDYYVHAKATGKDWHICLAIKLQGADQNVNSAHQEEAHQEFWITGHAKFFNRPTEHPDEYQKRRYPYFTRRMRDEYVIFEQLPYEQIDAHHGEVFQQFSKKSHPARLAFHAQNATKLLPSKGYLIHKFTTGFVQRLRELGIPAQLKERTWVQYTPSKQNRTLPQQLDQIYIYDNRKNQTTHPIEGYQQILAEHYTDQHFVVVRSLDDIQGQPVLILQDTSADDYVEGGIFFGEEDPYKVLYRKYPKTPKQSINVNEFSNVTNFAGSRDEYLTYPMIALMEQEDEEDQETETGWAMQFQVSLYQLYLKNVVINQKAVSQSLPVSGSLSSLMDYIYIRKQTYKGNSYHVALRVENDHLEFYDLRSPEEKDLLSEITGGWGYDWRDIEDSLYEKYHKNKDEGKEVIDYDLILMPESAVELETVDETVIYKYDEITRRLDIRGAKHLIENLFLAPHYDELRPKGTVSQFELEKRGLLTGRHPNDNSEEASVCFWQQLQQYDQLLEDMRQVQSRISYDEFVDLRRNEIGSIFKFPKDKNDKYITTKLLGFYKVIWGIGGFKGDDVQISKGIWFNPKDLAYMVGDVNGFKDAQDRANLVRRFDVLYGSASAFDFQVFLEATAVRFIRYQQYTVYPYPFYLIEKYIQDVLYHQ